MPSQTNFFSHYIFYWNLEPGVPFLGKTSFALYKSSLWLPFRFLIKVGLAVRSYPQEVQRREQKITFVILQNIFKVTVQSTPFFFAQRQLIKGKQIPTGQVSRFQQDRSNSGHQTAGFFLRQVSVLCSLRPFYYCISSVCGTYIIKDCLSWLGSDIE